MTESNEPKQPGPPGPPPAQQGKPVKAAQQPSQPALSASDVKLALREKAIKELIRKEQERKVSILVVDDYAEARQLYESYLDRKGYRVLSAANAEEALISFSAASVHLVILDYNLPDMNGVALLHKIREIDIHVPIIMVTGNDNESVVKQAITGGISSYLLKPVKYDLFMERVQKALGNVSADNSEPPPIAT